MSNEDRGMTTELTHVQAAILRTIDSGIIAIDAMVHDSDLLWAYDSFDGELSDDGVKALEAYDAKWATVRKDDLQVAVNNLEAKIEESDAKCHRYGLQSELYKLDYAREALARLKEMVKWPTV